MVKKANTVQKLKGPHNHAVTVSIQTVKLSALEIYRKQLVTTLLFFR